MLGHEVVDRDACGAVLHAGAKKLGKHGVYLLKDEARVVGRNRQPKLSSPVEKFLRLKEEARFAREHAACAGGSTSALNVARELRKFKRRVPRRRRESARFLDRADVVSHLRVHM